MLTSRLMQCTLAAWNYQTIRGNDGWRIWLGKALVDRAPSAYFMETTHKRNSQVQLTFCEIDEYMNIANINTVVSELILNYPFYHYPKIFKWQLHVDEILLLLSFMLFFFAYYHHPTNYGMQKIGFACDIAQWKYRMKVMKFWIKCTKWNKIIIEIYNVFYYQNLTNRFVSYLRDIFCFDAWCFSPRSRLDVYCKEMNGIFAWWNSLHKGPVFYFRLILAQTICFIIKNFCTNCWVARDLSRNDAHVTVL